MIYPWQSSQWQHILNAHQQSHLAHALLLTGSSECGKKDFAAAIAQRLLCQSNALQMSPPAEQTYASIANTPPPQIACGECKSCYVFRAKSHPDYKSISLIEGKKDISIEQIRALSRFLELSCSYGKMTIAIINDAERMNEQAANSLLKTLEEPPPARLIILVSSQANQLSATIRSRCQNINFPLPSNTMALAWLNSQTLQHPAENLLSIASGRPLLAKQFDSSDLLQQRFQCLNDLLALLQKHKSVVEISVIWEKHDFQHLLEWQIAWIQSIIRLNTHPSPSPQCNDITATLQQLARLLDAQQCWTLYDDLLKLMPRVNHPVNKRLFAEKMLLIWCKSLRNRL
jgi:DNA polymerase-3 subunit delta'